MIYKGLNRTGMIGDIKTKGGGEIAEVYGGIGESDPIYYKQREMVGTSPMQFKALGLPLKDYLISGNTLQDGIPTPDMPVDVVGCGVKTRNLYDYRKLVPGYTYDSDGQMILNPDTANRWNFAAVPLIEVEPGATYLRTYDLVPWGNVINFYDSNKNFLERAASGSVTTVPSNCNFVSFVLQIEGLDVEKYMFTKGSTPPETYAPYGYKLPLTVTGTEYPIYLGQVETTRRIKKLVFDGTENYQFAKSSTRSYSWYMYPEDIGAIEYTMFYCSHGTTVTQPENYVYGTVYCDNTINLGIFPSTFATQSDVLAWLAAQYAAGTPVIIWYVLAEPETGVVNEPLHKIGDYADTISMAQAFVTIPTTTGTNTLTVGTTVQPSAVSITGNIKPTGYGQLLDVNDVDIQDSNGTPIFIQG